MTDGEGLAPCAHHGTRHGPGASDGGGNQGRSRPYTQVWSPVIAAGESQRGSPEGDPFPEPTVLAADRADLRWRHVVVKWLQSDLEAHDTSTVHHGRTDDPRLRHRCDRKARTSCFR